MRQPPSPLIRLFPIDRTRVFGSMAMLVVLLVAIACSSSVERPETPPGEPSAAVNSPALILALGDSYTVGESVRLEDSWPLQLARRLNASGVSVADPEIIARTGWTTSDLTAAIDGISPVGPYELVTLQIGVNNQSRGGSIAEFKREFAALLQTAARLAGGRPDRVFVLSIPDWSVTPFARGLDRTEIRRDVDDFNQAIREESADAGIRLLDITEISREASENLDLVASDGLHPSALMYRRWVDLVEPIARSLLAAIN